MFDSQDDHKIMTVGELLPMGFGPGELGLRQGSKGGEAGGGGGGKGSSQEVQMDNVGKATPAFMD